MTTCQLAASRSCYCPLWVSPSRLAVDHRHETSRLPLARRIYSAPYGRTHDVVVNVRMVAVCSDDHLVVLQMFLCKSLSQFQCLLRRDLPWRKGLDDVEHLGVIRLAEFLSRPLHLLGCHGYCAVQTGSKGSFIRLSRIDSVGNELIGTRAAAENFRNGDACPLLVMFQTADRRCVLAAAALCVNR